MLSKVLCKFSSLIEHLAYCIIRYFPPIQFYVQPLSKNKVILFHYHRNVCFHGVCCLLCINNATIFLNSFIGTKFLLRFQFKDFNKVQLNTNYLSNLNFGCNNSELLICFRHKFHNICHLGNI